MIHELKIKPEYFAAIYFGDKTFEIRNNADRNFQVGDTLLLWEWDGGFTSQTVERSVSYITDFEQKPGYVVLGLVNHREHELLEKFHRTGVAIERAISIGSVLADHPLKSRLELLANHHEREMELVAQLSDATRQCGVMAELLRTARAHYDTALENGDFSESSDIEYLVNQIDEIDATLAGKLPEPSMPEGWELVEKPNCFVLIHDGQVIASMAGPTAEGTAAILASVPDGKVSRHANQDELVSVSDIASLQRYTLGGNCDSFGQDCGAEMERDDEGEYVLLADALMLAAAAKPEHTTHNLGYVQGASDFKQELLKSTKAFVHPHIEGVFAVFNNLHERAMLAAAPKPEPTKGRTITEGQEFELTTVLQAIVGGFSDDPAHDAAALLKRITGEVPWTGDSFQLPPRQGGEPCATEHPSSSPD